MARTMKRGYTPEMLIEEIELAYPRDRYRTAEQPDRDYNFGPADVLEMERAMRRRLKV